jgi:single-strand DNA-binding protein
MFQQVMLVGNLGRDPEMRYTPSGVPVANFSLAVSRRFQSQDGQWQDKTIWFRVTAWRKTAETVSQYLTKGSKVLVIGELEEPNVYTDRNNETRVSLEVTAQTIRFLSARGDGAGMDNQFASEPVGMSSGGGASGGNSGGSSRGNSNRGGGKSAPPANDMDMTDEDIPF